MFALMLTLACGGDELVTDTAADETVSWTHDVQPVLAQYCSGCHGAGGCSTQDCWLDDYAIVTGETSGVACASHTIGECLTERITNGTMPPPGGCLPGDPGCITAPELDVVKSWVAAGMPE